MKSRITIDVDFDNGNLPVIEILQYPDSSDVRDRLIKHFLELAGGRSWCRIQWKNGEPGFNRIHIQPIRMEELRREASDIQEECDKYDKWVVNQTSAVGNASLENVNK